MPAIYGHMRGSGGQEVYRLGLLASEPYKLLGWWLRKVRPVLYAELVAADPGIFESREGLIGAFKALASFLADGEAGEGPVAAPKRRKKRKARVSERVMDEAVRVAKGRKRIPRDKSGGVNED